MSNWKKIVTGVFSIGAVCAGAAAMNTQAFEYTPVEGDCWSLIVDKFGEQYNFGLQDLLEVNNASIDDYVYVGVDVTIPENNKETTSPPAKEKENFYVTQSGDGWYLISDKTGVPVDKLLELNGADLDTMIYVGQIIVTGKEYVKPPVVEPSEPETPAEKECNCCEDCKCGEKESDTPPVVTSMVTTTTTQTTTTTTTTQTTTTTTQQTSPPITTTPETILVSSQTPLGSVTLCSWCDDNSWFNVCHAADLLNGFELGNMESFSWYYFPAFSHQCGYEDGFIDGGAFSGSGTTNVPGGGICFPSTALYQCAVLQCGMEPLERHNHIRPVSYAAPGQDAAISLDVDPVYRQDMKFINTTGKRVKFEFSYDSYNRTLTVTCYQIERA